MIDGSACPPRITMISTPFRTCLLEPEPKIFEAAQMLDHAVTAHLEGQTEVARDLFVRTNLPEIRNWTEKLWDVEAPNGFGFFRKVPNQPRSLLSQPKAACLRRLINRKL